MFGTLGVRGCMSPCHPRYEYSAPGSQTPAGCETPTHRKMLYNDIDNLVRNEMLRARL